MPGTLPVPAGAASQGQGRALSWATPPRDLPRSLAAPRRGRRHCRACAWPFPPKPSPSSCWSAASCSPTPWRSVSRKVWAQAGAGAGGGRASDQCLREVSRAARRQRGGAGAGGHRPHPPLPPDGLWPGGRRGVSQPEAPARQRPDRQHGQPWCPAERKARPLSFWAWGARWQWGENKRCL